MHTNNPRIQSLLTLGEPRIFSSDQWPDYVSQYGFTTDDVPALLALLADETIDALPETRPEVWAPVYAWRILGQLGSEAAIAPLIGSFDRFCHDDCALSELAKVIAMLGSVAIPVLLQHWQQPDRDEFSHVLAMDALSEIATQHPATRAQILNIFRAYMLNPATSAHTLHGLLMGRLLDLKATEAIEEIRHLFALNCVDTTCAGDLEEVEIELGFRTERSAPKKHYALHAFGEPRRSGAAGFDEDAFEHHDDDAGNEIDADLAASFDLLDDYLLHYGSDEAILGASELDGYFAAMACAPTTILPSTWLPAIWGGEQYMPPWESEHELQEFSNAVFRHYNSVMQDFLEDDYEPQFLVSDITATELLLVDDWCEGFLRGITLWENLPADAAAKLKHWLAPIRLFGTEAGHATLAAMNELDIVQAQSSIEPNVKSMRRHLFNPVRRAGTFVHATPKTGRNDLCPCGSGKKHKKCCALH